MRGLLKHIDNENKIVTLEDIEDMGNAYDKEHVPHDKKIEEKVFEADHIEEIVLTEKVFADPKKYNRDDFFDSMTEHKEPKFRDGREERGEREYKPRGGYRGGRGGGRGSNNDHREKR